MSEFDLKLGKLPHVPDGRDIRFRDIAPPSRLPIPPSRFGYGTIFGDWGMLGNDRVGDCVPAGMAHEVMGFNRLAGHPVTFDEASVLRTYTDVGGYNPNDPSTDQGCDVRAAHAYWQTEGIVDSAGARHKIGAYVFLTPGDYVQLMQAAYLFEFVGIGVTITRAQQEQFQAGLPWEYVPGSPVEGGHYVVPTGRASLTDNGLLTWGKRWSFTRPFYEKQCDEAIVAVTSEELANGVNRRGLNLDALNQALQEVQA
jgi:hypothetical protein